MIIEELFSVNKRGFLYNVYRQMLFDRPEFHHALIMNNGSLDEYLLACLRSALDPLPSTKLFLLNLFSQIRNILTDNYSLPILKVSCAKFLIYLFSLGDIETLSNIQQNIYPILKQNAMIDRHLPLNQRGEKIFTLHPQYDQSSHVGKEMMRILGKEYVRFCLETIPVWSSELPTDLEVETRASAFFLGYQELRKMGIEFPREEDYVIYTKANNQARENRIKILVDRLDSGSTIKNSSLISQRERERRNKRKSESMLLRTLSRLSQPKQLVPQTHLQVPNQVSQERVYYENKTLISRQPSEIRSLTPTTAVMVSKGLLTTTIPSTQPDYPNEGIIENMLQRDGFSKELSQGSHRTDRNKEEMEAQSKVRYTNIQIIRSLPHQQTIQQDFQAPPLHSKPQSSHTNPPHTHPNAPRFTSMGSQNSIPIPSTSSSELERMYQTRMTELSHTYKIELEQTVTSLKAKYSQQLTQYKSMYERLREQNVSLKAEISQKNIKLSEYMGAIQSLSEQKNRFQAQVQRISTLNSAPKHFEPSSQQQALTEQLRKEIKRLKIENFQLRKTFLNECQEHEEFYTEQLKEQKDRIVVFNFQQNLYCSSVAKLSQEDKMRFKRSILKHKSILYRNQHLEIGCMTSFKELNIIKVRLFITNISPSQIHSFKLQLHGNTSLQDIQFVQQENPITILPPKYQEQLNYVCKIRHKDFKIPELLITYISEGLPNSLLLLFPATKYKLVQPLSHPHLSWYKQLSIQRVIPVNQVILPSISKLKDIFPTIYEGKESYIVPAMYLNEQYQLEWKEIDSENIRLRIVYEKGSEDNAYQLMEELAFLLGVQ